MMPPEVLPGAWAQGAPSASAVLRASPEDFVVEELPRVLPDGEGEHLWLHVRKRGRTTAEVAGALARHWGVPARDVGHAGLKDRAAVTTQWLSVRLPGRQAGPPPELDGVEWLALRRHSRKLATGALRGNRFVLRLREVAGDRAMLEQRLARLATEGVPNYFGPQRFGRDGDNLARAWRLLVTGGRERHRQLRGLLYSAARSWCFNRVLLRRVTDGSWNRLLPGELAALEGSRSVFAVGTPDAELEARLAAFDIHPSGPLPGRGGQRPTAVCAALEDEALAALRPLIDGLVAAKVDAGRRALRLRPAEFTWAWEDDGRTLRLAFELPAGAYATTVVRELVDTGDRMLC